MSELEDLQAQMEAAAAALDYEEARRLRDRISLLRGGAGAQDAAAADTAGLVRQQPGAMGLGSSQQRMTPPKGWTPPPKPDLMTKGRSRKR
ncbi:UvrB/UvrC motif-containing protein [Sphingomonas sp. PAMC 26617]|uniref:UvrB/UvrC motif-containing protein n=1 Tax=Sphingomonas sp. PAMC 26617 TaxID=1112216 RepID=UPI00028970BE|nr:UvrB/UvrC motif-containing protein [Sphingomonas sp. PAMC 26617]